MKSPFPGMDPYLEKNWRDVHHRLCTYACDLLQPQIRPRLLARIEERLVVETDDYQRSIYPDVSVVEKLPTGFLTGKGSPIGLAEPMRIKMPDEPVYDGIIQIIDPTTGNQVITIIEFLSISPKTKGNGSEQYLAKQNETIRANVSIVEIDLLRAGEWVLMADPALIPVLRQKPYRACIRRSWEGGQMDYYHFPIREQLKKLPVPLREHDEEPVLDLQEIINRLYVNGGYDSINYSVPPVPPLDPETAAWAKDQIANRQTD